MKIGFAALALALASTFAQAANHSLVVFQDPDCGCCMGWVEHMQDAGFEVKVMPTSDMLTVKQKLGVPLELASCHTAVVEGSWQLIEGHVPANAVHKMLADSSVKGVAAPGMPLNAPGMGELDGTLVTVDFDGRPFSQD